MGGSHHTLDAHGGTGADLELDCQITLISFLCRLDCFTIFANSAGRRHCLMNIPAWRQLDELSRLSILLVLFPILLFCSIEVPERYLKFFQTLFMRDLMLCIVLAISLEPVCTLLFFYLLLSRQSFVSVAIRNFLRYTNYARKSLLAVSQPFTFTFFYSVIVFYADCFPKCTTGDYNQCWRTKRVHWGSYGRCQISDVIVML